MNLRFDDGEACFPPRRNGPATEECSASNENDGDIVLKYFSPILRSLKLFRSLGVVLEQRPREMIFIEQRQKRRVAIPVFGLPRLFEQISKV